MDYKFLIAVSVLSLLFITGPDAYWIKLTEVFGVIVLIIFVRWLFKNFTLYGLQIKK